MWAVGFGEKMLLEEAHDNLYRNKEDVCNAVTVR